jgi:FkbM family methyltransferase
MQILKTKTVLRGSLQKLLALLPAKINRYILSCYHNLPGVVIRTGFNVLRDLSGKDRETKSTSSYLFANCLMFQKLIRHHAVPVVFDVGANVGQTSASYAKIFAGASINAFEPFAENYAYLRGNLRDLPNVIPHHLALSDQDGSLEIRRDHHPLSQWNSLNPDYQQQLEQRGDFSFESITRMRGDTFCRQNAITELVLLKIDTEGHEIEVLRGFDSMFKRSAIHSVLVEVGFGGDVSHGSFEDVNAFLASHGMMLFGFYDTEFNHDGRISYSNAFYCHENLIGQATNG